MRGTATFVGVVLLLAGTTAGAQADLSAATVRVSDAVRSWDDADPDIEVTVSNSRRTATITAGSASLGDVDRALGDADAESALSRSDGTWSLSASIVVADGATLSIRDADLRLLDAGLHAAGGDLVIRRTTVTGWDADRREADSDHTDGRGWLLVTDGGQLNSDDATLSHLGTRVDGRSGVSAMGAGSLLRLDGVTLTANYDGVHVGRDSIAALGSVHVTDAVRDGIRAVRAGRLVVRDANVVGNAGDAVALQRTRHVQITDSALHANHGAGVSIADSADVRLVRTRIYRNPTAGVTIDDSRDVVIDDCDIHTGAVGVAVHGEATAVTMRSSRIAGNRTDGVNISERTRQIEITGNRIDFNNKAAVTVKSASVSVTDNTLTQNFDGVRLKTPAGATIDGSIRGNEIVRNVQDGVDLPAGPSLPVVDNTIADNRGGGISVVTAGDAATAIDRNTFRDNARGDERVRDLEPTIGP